MKDGSGSASAPSVGVNSLAIAERRKPAPSCVAALFQMFAKRKLFSSTSKKNKLLPPVRAQKFSPGGRPGGGDTSPAAKRTPLLLDSANYSRSEGSSTNFLPPPDQEQNCSEMRTPGVVARLMGLSSIPAASHQTSTKVTEPSKLGDHRNAGSQDRSGTSRSIYTSPQKQQKTERLADGKRHGNASQFSASATRPLWPGRNAHKIASPVKSPRSMSSRNKARLVEAAAKVLENGLKSRDPHLSRRQRHAHLENSCNGDDGAPGAAVLHNFSGQFLADMCDVDAPKCGAHSTEPISLHNSTTNQWTEEVGKCSIPARSGQNSSCQMQPEGNDKCLLVSLSEKPGFGDSVQRTTNCVSVRSADIRRNQLRNMSLRSVSGGSLKQNNQKQNALPTPCKEDDPGYTIKKHKHRSREQNAPNTGQDFVSLNKRMTGGTSLRSKRKVMDRFSESHTGAENKNMSTKGRHTSSQHSDRSNKLKSKTATQRAMEKDMIIAKGAGLVIEKPKSPIPNCARSDLQRHAVSHNVSSCNKKSGIVSFTFRSSMKVALKSSPGYDGSRTGTAVQGSPVGTCPKRHSRRDGQSKHLPRELDFREVQGASSVETAESAFFNQDKLKHRGIDGRATSSWFEKKSVIPVTVESLGDEQQLQCNLADSVTHYLSNASKQVQLHETRKDDAKGRRPSPSITRGSNKRSPTSNLQSISADDAIISGISINTVAGAFTDSHPVETLPATQNVTTEGNSSFAEPNSGQHGAQPVESVLQGSKLAHPGKVTSTVELLLSNVCSFTGCQSKQSSSKTFLLQTIESTLATLTTSSRQDFNTIKATEASPLRNLAIDFVLELLDLMCAELCDSGYRSFSKLALICKEERLAGEIRSEIAKCGDMAGRALDDLAVSDVEHTVETGMNSMLEAFQISAQIEHDLVQELVDEIGLDIFKHL